MSDSAVVDHEMQGLTKKATDRITNVYIWDMDETLILLKSLLNGNYAGSFNGLKEVQKGVEIGKMWEKHILQLSDELFFYEQVSLPLSFFSFFFFSGLPLVGPLLICTLSNKIWVSVEIWMIWPYMVLD